MTFSMKSPDASSAPTKTFEQVNGARGSALQTESVRQKCKVFYIPQVEDVTPARHTAMGDLVAEWNKDEKRRVAMVDARRWAAEIVHADEGDTVRSLRLRKGWSQVRLAHQLGTSQPHVARIERGTENVSIDTCRRLAAALGVDMNSIDGALQLQEAAVKVKAKR